MKLLFNNLADMTTDAAGGTLSSDTTADVGFQLANILNPLRTKVWKSSSAVLGAPHYIMFDLGSPKQANSVALINTNLLSNNGQLSLQGGDSPASWTAPALNVTLTSANLDVENDDVYAYFQGATCRYWRILFTPALAPYIGRVFLGNSLALTDTLKAGYADECVAVTTAMQSVGGQMFVDQRNSYRVFNVEFGATTDGNKYAELGAFASAVGVNQYFVATLDETSLDSISKTTIYCRLADFPKFKNLFKTANGHYHSAQMQLLEVP
jgi:hypothetical protein